MTNRSIVEEIHYIERVFRIVLSIVLSLAILFTVISFFVINFTQIVIITLSITFYIVFFICLGVRTHKIKKLKNK